MKNLINDTAGVNIGLMTLSRRQSLVVKNIDKGQQRTDALKQINAMKSGGNTPIAKALYDAARYFNGFSDKHNSQNAIKQAAASPITDECQPSHFVLLTDGQAAGYDNTTKINIEKLIGDSLICPNRTGSNSDPNGEACSIELIKWMYKEDQSPLPNTTIITHAIGFALDARGARSQGVKDYLNNVAKFGGSKKGDAYIANNADELGVVFNEVIRQATQVQNTSFVNPSPTGGDYQSDEHKKQVYYPMFQPVEHDRWPGNLKRYGLRVNGNNLIEIDNSKPPIDAKDADGQFRSNAQSWWSASPDGSDVSKGGAAYQLSEPNKRNLWTSIDDAMLPFPTTQTSGNNITLGGNPVENDKFTATLLKANNDDERKEILRYIRGFEEDGKTPRRALGDPLHSAPTLFSYECQGDFNSGKCNERSDKENTTQMALIGTNEGFVHMFDTTTGTEQFAFMPEELLGNLKRLYEDRLTGSRAHIYGMDNTLTVWVNDKNNNGTVDGDDKVYAYATMRRGGSSIYALNITDRTHPTLEWKISAGDSGFERLGQTWSQPVKTKIDIDGKITDVLIFGGGYDKEQDTPENYRIASQGSDIYIVNAETGEKLWSASNDLKITEMKYSIPGNVRVLSLDNSGQTPADGLATEFFVGDVGGQIWRFFINNGKPKEELVTGGGTNNNGLFADFGGTPSKHDKNARRFYHGAEVAAEDNQLFVIIGSGYRAHPLDTAVKDRLYSIHVPLADNGKTLREKDLYPIKDGKFNGDLVSAHIKDGKSVGWLIELQGLGEKIISTPKTIHGRLFFNTYIPPAASSNRCSIGLGSNLTQNVDVLNGAPSNSPGNYADYALLSQNQGTLGDPNVICFEGNCWVQFGRGEFSDPFSRQAGLGRKIYWIDLQQ